MFLSVIFVVLCLFSLNTAKPPKHGPNKEQLDACMKEVGIKEEERDMFRMEHHEEIARDPALKEKKNCLVKCLWTSNEMLDKNGNIDLEKVKSRGHPLSEEEMQTVTECVEKYKTVNSCDDMGEVIGCFPKPKHHPPPPRDD